MIVAAFGVIVTISGIALGIVVGRRQFNRRNENGIETFSSYSAMLGNRFLDGVIKTFGTLAAITGPIILAIGLLWGDAPLYKQHSQSTHRVEYKR